MSINDTYWTTYDQALDAAAAARAARVAVGVDEPVPGMQPPRIAGAGSTYSRRNTFRSVDGRGC